MKDNDFRERLLADTNVTAIVSTRIWTTWLPEKTTFPAITCNYLSDTPENTLEGEADIEHEVITINLWCENKPDLVALYAAVKASLNGWAVRLSKVDLSDAEQGQFRLAVDYSLWG